jgi:hypothetical protein
MNLKNKMKILVKKNLGANRTRKTQRSGRKLSTKSEMTITRMNRGVKSQGNLSLPEKQGTTTSPSRREK